MIKLVSQKNNIQIENKLVFDKKQYNIKNEIKNNSMIENSLNVIAVLSNPCLYVRRYTLARDFIERMKNENNVTLYIVELAYGNQKFRLTDPNNPNHLQLRTEVPLWHKENLINIGIKNLLPADWKAVAWIDLDIEFENVNWASDTLKILNGSIDIVQLFSHCLDLDPNGKTSGIDESFAYKTMAHVDLNQDLFLNTHPGYAWAIKRSAYEHIGKLFDFGIVGSGDSIIAYSLMGNIRNFSKLTDNVSYDLMTQLILYQSKVKWLNVGYVPGIIKHHFHGYKVNRNYKNRWQILTSCDYTPTVHLTYDKLGILVPTYECPKKMLSDILDYFKLRKEDEIMESDDTTLNVSNIKPK